MFFSNRGSTIPSKLDNKNYSWLEMAFNIGSKVCLAMSIFFIIYIVARVINV
jgi:hypothetical protein